MVAKANKLDLDIVYTKPPHELPQDYLKLNPLGKIPTFVGADGYELTEAIAIAIYSMATHHHTADLLPFNDETYYRTQLSLSEDHC